MALSSLALTRRLVVSAGYQILVAAAMAGPLPPLCTLSSFL